MYNKIIKAKELINQHIINSPFYRSNALSEVIGKSIYVKYENRQLTGSFKYRGSLNKLLSLTKDQKRKGVIAMSAGNHAQGISLGCKQLNIKFSGNRDNLSGYNTGNKKILVYAVNYNIFRVVEGHGGVLYI